MIRWFLFLVFVSSAVLGQQKVEGVIQDKETGEPVPFASLIIMGTPHGTSSNLEGQFSLVVPDTFSVKITCIGYESLTVTSSEALLLVKLEPSTTQLAAIVFFHKEVNPGRIVRKAFSRIDENYDTESFLQKFFYRHYTRRDSLYERLVEASVDVWKHHGYKHQRAVAGEREEIRVTQLRRSLDIMGMVQGQKPLHLGFTLQSDFVGYQANPEQKHPGFFETASNLKADFDLYKFSFDRVTTYDGHEVYKIDYALKEDSVLTVSGYKPLPQITGSLYITTKNFAFVKIDEVKFDHFVSVRTTAYYRKQGRKYYPYHFIREGQNFFIDHRYTSFHVEMISLDIRHGGPEKFTGREPDREALLKLPYDSMFWNTTSILKATPLEDDIVRHLGRGLTLNKQFFLYKQYEQNVTDGGNDGETKFNWLLNSSKGKRILYICFWDENFKLHLPDFEYIKQLNLKYKHHITFVLVSLLSDETQWKQLLTDYNMFSDGMINYRIDRNSDIVKRFNAKHPPAYVLIPAEGDADVNAKNPKNPLLAEEFGALIESGYK